MRYSSVKNQPPELSPSHRRSAGYGIVKSSQLILSNSLRSIPPIFEQQIPRVEIEDASGKICHTEAQRLLIYMLLL